MLSECPLYMGNSQLEFGKEQLFKSRSEILGPVRKKHVFQEEEKTKQFFCIGVFGVFLECQMQNGAIFFKF